MIHDNNINMTPQFEHDCDACEFMGRWLGPEGLRADLYVHGDPTTGKFGSTVIARYSSDGGDYQSGTVFAQGGMIPELAVCYIRFLERKIEQLNGEIVDTTLDRLTKQSLEMLNATTD